MLRGPPGVAVPAVLPRLRSILFNLLRLGFQPVVCCVLGTWFEDGRVRSLCAQTFKPKPKSTLNFKN